MSAPNAGPVTEPDPAYERFARLVQAYLGVSAALVSLACDDEWMAFPGAVGLTEPWASQRGLPIASTFCQYVMSSQSPIVIADTNLTDLHADDEVLAAFGAVSYIGYPVRDGGGKTVGTLCALDDHPRQWTSQDLAILADLAEACSTQVQLRAEGLRAREAETDATRRHEHAQALLEMSESFSATTDVAAVLDAIEAGGVRLGARRTSVGFTDARGHFMEWARHGHVPGMPESVWRGTQLDSDAWPFVAAIRARSALFYEDDASLVAAYPRMEGIGADGGAAFVPLVTRSGVLGVVVLRWDGARVVDGDLLELITALAGYAALALERARLLEHRRDVAHVLQTAMLTHLPDPDGLELDGAYSPASMGEQVGGDWYDALVLPHGTAVMIGDVTGHDIDAAALMGQLRSLLRGYTWADEDQPSAVLHRLDAANIGTGLGATASVVLGHLEPPGPDGGRLLRWSSAGHLPPFVKRADGSVERLDARADLILGILPNATRRDHDVVLYPGDLLVLYTDGLVERRGEPLHVGLERLAGVLAARTPDAKGLVEALVPDEFHQDDTAVLIVRVLAAEG